MWRPVAKSDSHQGSFKRYFRCQGYCVCQKVFVKTIMVESVGLRNETEVLACRIEIMSTGFTGGQTCA